MSKHFLHCVQLTSNFKVHISTCVGHLVGMWFPKYNDNGRKMRELLSAACSSGLSVAFGAPVGGVLFSYEEVLQSSYRIPHSLNQH